MKIKTLTSLSPMMAMAIMCSCAENTSTAFGPLSAEISADESSFILKKDGTKILDIAGIGLLTTRGEGEMKLDSVSAPIEVNESYGMLAGKRRLCSNRGTERVYHLSDSAGNRTDLRMRTYSDGFAFRYELNDLDSVKIVKELTSYLIPNGKKRWIQKWTEPYEEFFPMMTGGATENTHWVYPVLVEVGDDDWCLITEANIERRQSASSLRNAEADSIYNVWQDNNDLPLSGDWHSPWRVVMAGSLADVVESTLVTDVSEPSKLTDTDWIQPGLVSWVYWAYNHGSRDYHIVKRYIDMARDMSLPYTLIDAEWDEMGNGGDINDALEYARSQGVKPLIWYNSSTAWIGGPGPRFRLNSPEAREKEFEWLDSVGVAGVKIDFFSGDRQETMDYCIDLLESAAAHRLMVNFHGATMPRGWQRTYPHMMSTEGVYGAEWYNNLPVLTDKAAAHNATLPFTRNVVGPMDYTPVTFSDSQHPHITTHAHELALAVLFESALQHLADRPEIYMAQPEEVVNFLKTVPTAWDDTRLLGGYPGQSAVMARKKGNSLYVAGINGTDEAMEIPVDWKRLDVSGAASALMFEDSGNADSPWKISAIKGDLPASVSCQPRGGFAMRIDLD